MASYVDDDIRNDDRLRIAQISGFKPKSINGYNSSTGGFTTYEGGKYVINEDNTVRVLSGPDLPKKKAAQQAPREAEGQPRPRPGAEIAKSPTESETITAAKLSKREADVDKEET